MPNIYHIYYLFLSSDSMSIVIPILQMEKLRLKKLSDSFQLSVKVEI